MIISSKKNQTNNLAPRKPYQMAIDLLSGLANLQDGDDPLRWFRSHYPQVLADLSSVAVRKQTKDSEESFEYYAPCLDDESKCKYLLMPLRATLRGIWRAPDVGTKKWGMFRISQDFFHQGNAAVINTPLENPWDFLLREVKPPSQTERLLLQFVDLAEYTRYCDCSDCSAPYFIASKRSQKYCSTDCRDRVQREFKLKWWREKGSRQRSSKTKTKTSNLVKR